MKNQNFPKNEYMMSDLNDIPFYNYKHFKEDFKEDRSNDDSNMTFLYQSKYFRNDGKKKSDNDSDSNTENNRNYKTINLEEVDDPSDNENLICIPDLENDGIDNCEEDKKENEIEIKSDSESDDNYKFNINPSISLSLSNYFTKSENNLKELFNDNENNNKKIFKIVKVERFRDLPHKKRRGRGKYKSKKNDIDWENIITPKEKHFHLDRKKKRIVFQRKHLKMIYSIANLPYPFNFTELYKLIDEHVGDKTVNNYGNKKSYHIIKINGQTIITTMKEKKDLLGRKVKPKKID